MTGSAPGGNILNPNHDKTKQIRVDDEKTRARREFLKKIGKGSAAVPAAALLLAASAKKAQAVPSGACGGCGCGSGCGSGG
jgi:hypothetical protein